jgi:hypothetical protein
MLVHPGDPGAFARSLEEILTVGTGAGYSQPA